MYDVLTEYITVDHSTNFRLISSPTDVDPELSLAQRAAAEALIAAERSSVPDDPSHALLRPVYIPNLTEAMQQEVSRVAANQASCVDKKDRQPLRGIDLSRYEVGDDDDDDDGNTKTTTSGDTPARSAIRAAAVNLTYLRARRTHLALLHRYGKNAWLVGNWKAEADLRATEAALAQAKRDVDLVTLRRQRAQQAIAGELHGLESSWRTGVGRVLETEAAAEELRQQILDVRRQLAEQGTYVST